MLRFRPFHLFLLIFEFLFLNVVIPAHTRGIITIGCPECAAHAGVPICCHCHRDSQPSPTPDQQQHCAICNFAAHLMLPPVIDCRPAALRLAELLFIAQPASWQAIAIPTPYHGRAPPVLA